MVKSLSSLGTKKITIMPEGNRMATKMEIRNFETAFIYITAPNNKFVSLQQARNETVFAVICVNVAKSLHL